MTGKAVIVTGGASGIGRALVTSLVQQGHQVLIADIDDKQGHALVQELTGGSNSMYPCVSYTHCDITDPAAFVELFERGTQLFGAVHALVNNAGIAQTHEFWMAPQWIKTIQINLTATIAGTTAAIQYFTSQGIAGSVVNISSIAGLIPFEGEPVYAATKAGVLSFTRSLKIYAPLMGVRVNAVCPAFVDTPMLTKLSQLSPAHETSLAQTNKLSPTDVVDSIIRCMDDTTLA
ncbi:hypothetical protein H4R35_007141, partial [Dimargaris xerosporica]